MIDRDDRIYRGVQDRRLALFAFLQRLLGHHPVRHVPGIDDAVRPSPSRSEAFPYPPGIATRRSCAGSRNTSSSNKRGSRNPLTIASPTVFGILSVQQTPDVRPHQLFRLVTEDSLHGWALVPDHARRFDDGDQVRALSIRFRKYSSRRRNASSERLARSHHALSRCTPGASPRSRIAEALNSTGSLAISSQQRVRDTMNRAHLLAFV